MCHCSFQITSVPSLKFNCFSQGITMNDGPEWRVVRSWLVRTLRTLGFGRREMCNLIKEEVTRVLDNLGSGGVKRLYPVVAPAVISVLWTLTTGKRLCEGPRYIKLSISLHSIILLPRSSLCPSPDVFVPAKKKKENKSRLFLTFLFISNWLLLR